MNLKKMINKGFTQIELILSMGILMILIGVMSNVFGQIVDVQIESKQISSIDQNGRYVLARLIHDMQNAQSIASPSAVGEPVGTMKIRINSIDYTYSVSPSGNLILTNNNGVDVLNSSSTSVSGLTFTRIGTGSNSDTIRVGFTLTSRTIRLDQREIKSFQTTLGLQ
jgi:hypothetical protein